MTWDVFFSYPRADAVQALPLVEALRAHGLAVWLDTGEVADTASISRAITEGLAQSRLLLAWYSPNYVRSRACQWELTAAFLAGDPAARIRVINPAEAAGHIHPADLRDTLFLPADDVEEAARRVAAQVATLTTTLGAVRSLARPIWHGRRRLGSNRFVGRLGEMWTIHSLLNAAERFAAIGAESSDTVQVQGLGGIGKSLLAEEYALRFGAAYPGGIVWLSALETRHDQLSRLALALDLPVQGVDPVLVLGMLRRWLADLPSYLWVVDDLSSDARAAELSDWLALSRSAKVLPLGVLSRVEALDLLCVQRPARSAEEQAAAEQIVDALGCHALAVDVAGAAVAQMGFADFLAELSDRSQDVLDLAAELAGQLPNDHEPAIAATLLHSIRSPSLSEDGRRFLQLASLLAAAPIPRALIDGVFARLPEEHRPARHRALLAVNAAARHSLAEADDAEVTVHTLVSRTIRFHRRAPESLRQAVLAEMLAVLPETKDVRPHADLHDWMPHAQAVAETDEGAGERMLLNRTWWHYHKAGDYPAAEAVARRLVERCREAVGEDHPDTLGTSTNLAETLCETGKLDEALRLQDDLSRRSGGTLGQSHMVSITVLANRAKTLLRLGRLTEARAQQEQVVTVFRHELEDHAPQTLKAENVLAEIIYEQGDRKAAHDLHRQLFETRLGLLGADHMDTLESQNNLAKALVALGRFDEALPLQEQVLAGYERHWGRQHPNTLTAIGNLAEAIRALANKRLDRGALARAQALHEEVWAGRRQCLGDDHLETIGSLSNLACAVFDGGDLVAARPLLEQCLEKFRRIVGKEDARTLKVTVNLCHALAFLGELNPAKDHLEEALKTHGARLGQRHPDILRAHYILAGVLYRTGNVRGARTHLMVALPIARSVLGDQHPTTIEMQRAFDKLNRKGR